MERPDRAAEARPSTQTQPPADPAQEERTASGLMIFAVASSIIVVLVVAALLIVMLSFARQGTTTPASGPYNLSGRPVPSVNSAEELFPAQLGRFQRGSLVGSLDDFEASYSSGTDQITIRGSRAVSFVAAQRRVSRVSEESGPANVAQELGTGDPSRSFYLTQRGDSARYAWSHNEWFFDLQASSRAALDEFMNSFQY